MPQVSSGSAHLVIHSIILSASTVLDAQSGLGHGMGTGVQRRHSPWPGGAHGGRVRRYVGWQQRRAQCVLHLRGPGLHPSSHSTSWDPQYDMSLI